MIEDALQKFKDWNRPEYTDLERHEILKSILLQNSEHGTVEYPITINSRRGRIDFVGNGYAVEIDHSMKPRSLEKLQAAMQKGLKGIWIIIRMTGSYPRHFGRMERKANQFGIKVIMLRNLAGTPKKLPPRKT